MREVKIYNQVNFLKPICALDGEVLYGDEISEIKKIVLSNHSTYREAYESLIEIRNCFDSCQFEAYPSRFYKEHQNETVNQVISRLLETEITRPATRVVIDQVIYEIYGHWIDQKIKK